MKQEEDIVPLAFVLFVERLDALPCSVEKGLILGHCCEGGVAQIGQ